MKMSSLKGLLLYDFYSAGANMLIFFVLALLSGFAMLMIDIPGLFAMVTLFWTTIFSSSFIVCASKETNSKWTRFRVAMPVTRKNVIASKYLGTLLLLLIGIVFAMFFAKVSSIFHVNLRNNILESLWTVPPVCIGGALTTCSLFYPLIYTIGENKEETLSFICVFSGPVFWALIMMLGNLIGLPQIINASLCMAIAVILFIVSYIVTAKIYRKKDL